MKTNKPDPNATMLVITVGLLVLYLIFSWQWAVYASLLIGLIGVFSVALSRWIEKGWMALARILSYIVPTIILTVIFYLILFPVSLLSKLFIKDQLMRKNSYKSMFVDVNRNPDKKSFEKTW